ncbi:hypothetical protein E4T56_gene12736 [Termitomyces sp. T112]|nr:hypothetical protein E4T56_gene12736 [Termitomyces sp. T112]
MLLSSSSPLGEGTRQFLNIFYSMHLHVIRSPSTFTVLKIIRGNRSSMDGTSLNVHILKVLSSCANLSLTWLTKIPPKDLRCPK